MGGPVRVVIADDHPMFRDGLAAALLAVPELEVVGAAADGEQLIALVDRTQPDVVLTDLGMPGLGGADATRQILERRPRTKGHRADDARRRRGDLQCVAGGRTRVPPQGG